MIQQYIVTQYGIRTNTLPRLPHTLRVRITDGEIGVLVGTVSRIDKETPVEWQLEYVGSCIAAKRRDDTNRKRKNGIRTGAAITARPC